MNIGVLGGLYDLIHVCFEATVTDVVGDASIEQQRLLLNNADLLTQRFDLQLADVGSVEQDPTLAGIVKAGDEADKSRLARPRGSD